jgi:hypothetical protein
MNSRIGQGVLGAYGGHMLWAPDIFSNRLSAGHNLNWSIVQDAEALALDTWYFVAVTYDDAAGKMKLYKDGAVVDSATTVEGVSDSTISIGSFGSGNGQNWQGTIDDVRVYGHVLTPEQVMTLYTEGGNRIDSIETDVGDVWQAHVTPFSAADSGSTYTSNLLMIQEPTGIAERIVPRAYALYQNIPNPFNPTTVIRYDVPEDGVSVALRIYDVSGRLVRVLVDARESAGSRYVTWDGKDSRGRNVASGVYFCSFEAGGFRQTRKMVLLR